MAEPTTRVLYMSGSLPVRSETFVYRDILALRKLGLDKDVAATLMSDLNRAGVKARRAPFLYRAAERRRENRSSGGWGE